MYKNLAWGPPANGCYCYPDITTCSQGSSSNNYRVWKNCVECCDELTLKPVTNPATIPYNNAGSTISIVLSYLDLYTVAGDPTCPFTECKLYENDCSTPFSATIDIAMSSVSPYKLIASETNQQGY